MSASVISGICEKKNTTARMNTNAAMAKYTPLHVFKCLFVVKGEEDIRAQHRCHDGTNAVEGLGNVDTNFRVSGRAADYVTIVIKPGFTFKAYF